jgi:hypothetical protein
MNRQLSGFDDEVHSVCTKMCKEKIAQRYKLIKEKTKMVEAEIL